jgi:hypothetical protein
MYAVAFDSTKFKLSISTAYSGCAGLSSHFHLSYSILTLSITNHTVRKEVCKGCGSASSFTSLCLVKKEGF